MNASFIHSCVQNRNYTYIVSCCKISNEDWRNFLLAHRAFKKKSLKIKLDEQKKRRKKIRFNKTSKCTFSWENCEIKIFLLPAHQFILRFALILCLGYSLSLSALLFSSLKRAKLNFLFTSLLRMLFIYFVCLFFLQYLYSLSDCVKHFNWFFGFKLKREHKCWRLVYLFAHKKCQILLFEFKVNDSWLDDGFRCRNKSLWKIFFVGIIWDKMKKKRSNYLYLNFIWILQAYAYQMTLAEIFPLHD